jgi:AraC family transcriptional regulator
MPQAIRFVDRAPAAVFYRRYQGPYGRPLGAYWQREMLPWLAEAELLDCPRYGVALDDPSKTPPANCRYDCCVEPPPGLTIPGASFQTIAGGQFAIASFKGSAADISAAWAALIDAVHESGHQPDRVRPRFEHYPRGALFETKSGTFACELALPLAGLMLRAP